MIESRYKIEYELPDEDVKKTSPLRMLWYLLLISLVLLAVTAITYDFSLQNIARDSSVLIEKAKIHIFNLGDSQQFKAPKTPSTAVITEPVKTVTLEAKPLVKPVITKPIVTPKPNNNIDKKIINELTAKQKLQLKTIKEQIAKNTALSKDLSLLSNQLVLEKTKNETLNARLSEEEKDRLELEEQLNKMLTESKNNNVKLDNVTVKKEKIIPTQKILGESEAVKVVEKVEDTKTEEKTENLAIIEETKKIKVEQNQIQEQEQEKSETDKIIAAMETINPNPIAEAETAEKPETNEAKLDSQTINVNNQEKTAKDETDSSQTTVKSEIKNEDTEQTKVVSTNPEQQKSLNVIKDVIETEVVTETKTELVTEDQALASTQSEIKVEAEKTVTTEPPKTNTAVDDIIAAMQQSQSNTTKQNSDPELEKDIKQQLVEQGDVPVEN